MEENKNLKHQYIPLLHKWYDFQDVCTGYYFHLLPYYACYKNITWSLNF